MANRNTVEELKDIHSDATGEELLDENENGDDLIEVPKQEETVEEVPEVEDTSEETPAEEEVPETESVSEDSEVEKMKRARQALEDEHKKLLQQVTELKRERRELKGEKTPIVIPKKQVVTPSLEDVAEADVALIEKVLQAKGYVKKDDVEALSFSEKLESVQNNWLEKHPEYLPENDPDDSKWKALKAKLDLYRQPSNPQEALTILNEAHSSLTRGSLPTKNRAVVKASQEKIETSSKGSVTSGSSRSSKPSKSSNVNSNAFVGFSDEDLKELGII